jgi:uncharacterized UBP type Zn finger protein
VSTTNLFVFLRKGDWVRWRQLSNESYFDRDICDKKKSSTSDDGASSDSKFSEIFQGTTQEEYICTQCREHSLPQPESSMPFTIYVNVPEDDERAIMIEKSVDAEFRTATTVEDVMCDRCRQKVTKTRTMKIRNEPNAFIVNIRRAMYFGNDESDSSDFPVNFPVN